MRKLNFPVAYFTEGGRLGKSPGMVNPLLSLPGGYSFQERLGELEPKVKNLRDMKLEVMISRGLKSNGNFNLVNKPQSVRMKCYNRDK